MNGNQEDNELLKIICFSHHETKLKCNENGIVSLVSNYNIRYMFITVKNLKLFTV